MTEGPFETRWPQMFVDKATRPLRMDKETARKMLAQSLKMYQETWQLPLPTIPVESTDLDRFDTLPIANSPGQTTKAGVIGAVLIIAGGQITAAVQPLVDNFVQARLNVSEPLVEQVLKDADAYVAEFKRQLAVSPDPEAALARLAKVEADAKDFRPSAEELADATHDLEAPETSSLHYAVYAQYKAAGAAVALSAALTTVLTGVSGGLVGKCSLMMGNVKGIRRIVSKSMTKYGDFALCRDMARATICVDNLEDMATIAEALVDNDPFTISDAEGEAGESKHTSSSSEFVAPFASRDKLCVLRCKNRFDPKFDTISGGGYMDFQMQILVEYDGCWRYCECQINFSGMLKIKAGDATEAGGGHAAFDLARSIDSFSPRTLRYKGEPSADVFRSTSVGLLLELDLSKSKFTEDVAAAFSESIASPQCRLRTLRLNGCDLPNAALKAIGACLRESRCTLVELDLSANSSIAGLFAENDEESVGKAWAVLARGLALNCSVTRMDLSLSNIEDEGLIALGNTLASNSTLSVLDLASATGSILKQNTSDNGWVALAGGLAKNKGVHALDVRGNRMGEAAGLAFAEALAINTTLCKLKICQNPIGPTAGEAFATALKSNINIASFDIGDCGLKEDEHGVEAVRAIKDAWAAVDGRKSSGKLETRNKFGKDGLLIPVAPPSKEDIEELLSAGVDLSGLFQNDEMFMASQDREVGNSDQILGGMVARTTAMEQHVAAKDAELEELKKLVSSLGSLLT